MSDQPKPPALKAATIVWALVVVAALACTATGVVTLFGSKFGPGFGLSARQLTEEPPSEGRNRVDAGAQ
jgi:hypothetical protein